MCKKNHNYVFKTLVVAAGAGTSTETLVVLPGNKWTDAAPLPRTLVSVSFASLNNKFYIMGKYVMVLPSSAQAQDQLEAELALILKYPASTRQASWPPPD